MLPLRVGEEFSGAAENPGAPVAVGGGIVRGYVCMHTTTNGTLGAGADEDPTNQARRTGNAGSPRLPRLRHLPPKGTGPEEEGVRD